jgi:hypothetical protein
MTRGQGSWSPRAPEAPARNAYRQPCLPPGEGMSRIRVRTRRPTRCRPRYVDPARGLENHARTNCPPSRGQAYRHHRDSSAERGIVRGSTNFRLVRDACGTDPTESCRDGATPSAAHRGKAIPAARPPALTRSSATREPTAPSSPIRRRIDSRSGSGPGSPETAPATFGPGSARGTWHPPLPCRWCPHASHPFLSRSLIAVARTYESG